MYKEFKNDSWESSSEKESYVRTLKSIRFHKTTDRRENPTTVLLFISRLSDPSIRQHFEDSSRHFKTYNIYAEVSELFKFSIEKESNKRQKIPYWCLNLLDSIFSFRPIAFLAYPLLPKELKEHLAYRNKLRSLSEEEFTKELFFLFNMTGLTRFSKLNVVIGCNDDKNIRFGIQFLCKALNSSRIKYLLSNKNILIPDDYQTTYGIFKKTGNKLPFKTVTAILDVNKPLMEYLERKSSWVLDRKRVKDLLDVAAVTSNKTLIIGRRILTRGHDPINENSLIQSYDFKKDTDFKSIHSILKKFLEIFKQSNAHVLIIIENYPNQISYLISKDEELKSLLHGNMIALACIEPESKDVYTFEGDQFIQRSLKFIY